MLSETSSKELIRPKSRAQRAYKCKSCGKGSWFWLERGVGEPEHENYKPAPFAIPCECGGHMVHMYMLTGCYVTYRTDIDNVIPDDESYIANSQYSKIGVPVIKLRKPSKRDVYEETIKRKFKSFEIVRDSGVLGEAILAPRWHLGIDVVETLKDSYIVSPIRIPNDYLFGIPIQVNYDNDRMIRLVLEAGEQE